MTTNFYSILCYAMLNTYAVCHSGKLPEWKTDAIFWAGVWTNHSTSVAFIEKIATAIDKKHYCVRSFVDLKAFNTIKPTCSTNEINMVLKEWHISE